MSAIAIGVLVLAHLADYTTFVVMVAKGSIGKELNPIVATLFEDWGMELLTVAKFSTVLLVATVFLVVGRERPRLGGAVLVFGVLIGVLGAYSNILTIAA